MGGEHGHAIAGAGAFLGVVDRAIELTFDPHDKKRRQLTVHSRVTEAPDLLYELVDGELKALGEPDQVGFAEVKNHVLDTLNNEDWRSTQDVMGLLDEPRPSLRQTRDALTALFEAGAIERDPKDTKKGATYRWRVSQPDLARTTLIVPGQVCCGLCGTNVGRMFKVDGAYQCKRCNDAWLAEDDGDLEVESWANLLETKR
ncbi:MAG: hypothetical protein HY675_17870 [Chloroflexi bacterium]|nr:hypothetical protein [Chloroflexota bacterium]